MSDFDGLTADGLSADDLDLMMEAEDYVPESGCHVCGRIFGPDDTGHCSPITGGCCQNFASNHAFDRHMVRTRGGVHRIRCLTVEEMRAKGWTQTGKYDAWRTPAPQASPWKKEKNL